LGPIAV